MKFPFFLHNLQRNKSISRYLVSIKKLEKIIRNTVVYLSLNNENHFLNTFPQEAIRMLTACYRCKFGEQSLRKIKDQQAF